MAAADPQVTRAPHVDRETHLEDRLTGTLRTVGAGMWLAHVVDGVLCRQTDSLVSDGTEAEGITDTRDDLGRFSRLLSMFTIEQGAFLDGARTGSLIRLVLDGEGGSAYCYSVILHEHLVGVRIAPDPSGERGPDGAAEAAMAAMVTAVRADLGLPDLNPGGLAPGPVRETAATEPHVTGGAPGPSWSAARDATDTAVLHWVGLVRGDDLVASADHFDAGDLAKYFHLIAPKARRAVYEELARRSDTLFDQLDRAVDDALTGSVARIVLDVEEGAVVLHRLPTGEDEFLVAVTLDQTQVAVMESRATDLVRAWSG